MHDNTLIAIALSTSSLGILMLLAAMLFLEMPVSTITDASGMADGAPIRLSGAVVKTTMVSGKTIIILTQETTIPIVIEETIELESGTCIDVEGKRSSYKDQVQVDASKISECKAEELRKQRTQS